MTHEQVRDAWIPEGVDGGYPAKVSVARNVADDRQVVTLLDLDMSMAEFAQKRVVLTRPDVLERLAAIVDTTELAGVYEDVFDGTIV